MKNVIITGAQAKDARTALSKSQSEVGKATGISRAYLSQFENEIRKLTPSENTVLRDFFEDAGFIFTSDDTDKKAAIKESTKAVQSSLVGSDSVSIKSIELGELLLQVEDLIELAEIKQPPVVIDNFNLSVDDPELFELIRSEFINTEEVLENYFRMDAENNLKESGFFKTTEERALKIMAMMATQYLRDFAMRSGESLIPHDLSGVDPISEGREAEILTAELSSALSEKTGLDEFLTVTAR
tara:strand:- start:57 stop:782 length:726 start_codon:yes stop_codon:yes gene_type:complete